MLRYGVLGLLSYGSMTGYEIMGVFRDSLAFFWSASTSQIYRELQGLEAGGLATSCVQEQDARPNRRVYSITEAGRDELARWLGCDRTDAAADLRTRFPFLLRLFFMGEADAQVRQDYVQGLAALSERFAAAMSDVPKIIDGYGSHAGNAVRSPFWEMTADFGLRYARMLNEWALACQARLDGERDVAQDAARGVAQDTVGDTAQDVTQDATREAER